MKNTTTRAGQLLLGNEQYAVMLHGPSRDPITWTIFPTQAQAHTYASMMVLWQGEFTRIKRLPDLGGATRKD